MSTARGILGVFLAIVLWDVVVHLQGKETISEWFALTGSRLPMFKMVVVFSMGVLAGHWFWPIKSINNREGSQ